MCTFDCIYCECGFNSWRRPHSPMPTRQEVGKALEERLVRMQEQGEAPDVLTFAGNGEPTLHPDFPKIIDDTIVLRDRYFPSARISVLSNATMILRPGIFESLKRVDNNILKLDTVDEDFIKLVDRPTGHYDLGKLLEQLEAFKGQCIIQTMFLKGLFKGTRLDNTTDSYVLPWLEAVRRIAPRQVMIYTIDRDTPCVTLEKATHEELDRIAGLVREAGLEVSVSY